MDGASAWSLFFKIALPLSREGIVTISILAWLASWNELLVSMLLLSNQALRTLPIGLMGFINEYGSEYTQLAAGIMIALIPGIVFFVVAQGRIVGIGALRLLDDHLFGIQHHAHTGNFAIAQQLVHALESAIGSRASVLRAVLRGPC